MSVNAVASCCCNCIPQVAAENFGLTDEDVLALSDKQLNQIAGLRLLAPYRDDNKRLRPNYKALQSIKGEAAAAAALRRQKKEREKEKDKQKKLQPKQQHGDGQELQQQQQQQQQPQQPHQPQHPELTSNETAVVQAAAAVRCNVGSGVAVL
eukprot:GHRQ01037409.1.p2 GENE.GHRQ01037409.1~~GHRQ01037409.1.p2  ORF type:complete len:152 (-),score=90.38 GHRQ01037409.1:214-669(-)